MTTTTSRSVPALTSAFFGGLLQLVRANGRLLVHEVRTTAGLVGRRALLLIPTAALAVSGIAMLVVAASLYVGDLLGAPWMGFALVGGAAVVTGAAAAVLLARSIASMDLGLPVARAEIRKDVEWLKNRLKDD
jgi:putative superfamily III holin-X